MNQPTTQHTPGPWTVDLHGVVLGGERGGTSVAQICIEDWHDSVEYARQKGDNDTMLWAIGRRNQAEANGRLIAASPDLLAACKALLNCADSGRDFAECKAARAAIAKVEGGK